MDRGSWADRTIPWRIYDGGILPIGYIHLLLSFFVSVRDVRGASLISHSRALCKRYRLYACVRATGLVAPSRLSLLLVHFRAPIRPPLSLSLPLSESSQESSFYPYHDTAYTIIEMVTGIFGEAKLECRLSTKSSQRSRPTTTRYIARKRERRRDTHTHTHGGQGSSCIAPSGEAA